MDAKAGLVAKCLNASLGRWENFWASEKPSAVALEKEEDVWNKLVYTVCNPVEAGLVAKAEKWSGLIAFLPGQIIQAKRPVVYFRKDGEMPKSAKLTLTAPPQMGRFGLYGCGFGAGSPGAGSPDIRTENQL